MTTMRSPRLRDTDGTEYDPETGRRVGDAPSFYYGHKWSDAEIVALDAGDLVAAVKQHRIRFPSCRAGEPDVEMLVTIDTETGAQLYTPVEERFLLEGDDA